MINNEENREFEPFIIFIISCSSLDKGLSVFETFFFE